MEEIICWVADVGSVRQNRFGWCRAEAEGTLVGTDIHAFAEGIAADLSAGKLVALGFECPLFVPVVADPLDLTSARPGEGNRAWSAGAGSGALATGLPTCVWVFEQVGRLAGVSITPTLDWLSFSTQMANLFVWEAFVSGAAKSTTHEGDAEIAARTFWAAYPAIPEASAVSAPNPYSLVGAALLRAGLATDLSLLFQPCVVLKS